MKLAANENIFGFSNLKFRVYVNGREVRNVTYFDTDAGFAHVITGEVRGDFFVEEVIRGDVFVVAEDR